MELDLENPLSSSAFIDLHHSLFLVESEHMPSHNYPPQSLKATDDLDISVRSEAMSLILQISSNFDRFLSYLAINYLDRFLSIQPIPAGKPWVLRLLAVSCVSLAMKIRKTEFSGTDIEHDGGSIFDTQTIGRMEFLILGALKWRMRSVTPFSFINFFISLFKFKDPPLIQALKARATEIIFKAQNDIKLLEFKPSIIAASALLSASHELFPFQFQCFRAEVSNCSYVNKDKLFGCCNLIQEIARDGYESVMEAVSSSSAAVNVVDWQSPRLSLSSHDRCKEITNNSEHISSPAVGKERDIKRRKITSFKNDNLFQLSQIQQC